MAQPADTDSQQTPETVPQHASAGTAVWRLHVVASPDRRWAGRVVILRDAAAQAGRDVHGEHDLDIVDGALSRVHATLLPGPTGVQVRDGKSRNGTWVAGRKVDMATVGHGGVLRIGDTVAVVEADHGDAPLFDQPTANVPGQSEVARRVRSLLDLAARDLRPVLICGPTGTGKEFAATELYQRTGRFGKLVRVNAAAIPESLFEAQLFGHAKGAFPGASAPLLGYVREADGGTLVLDEIGELALPLQAKLLQLLEERTVRPIGANADVPVKARFVCTTNADLPAMVRRGTFRPDLLARLQAWTVTLPPLCDRRPDLLALADTVAPWPLASQTWGQSLDVRAVESLLLVDWPFNLRSMQAALIQAQSRMADGLTASRALARALHDAGLVATAASNPPTALRHSDTPATARLPNVPPPASHWRPDAALLRSLLREHGGSIEHVAAALGRNRKQVYRWMQYAGIGEDELARVRRGDG